MFYCGTNLEVERITRLFLDAMEPHMIGKPRRIDHSNHWQVSGRGFRATVIFATHADEAKSLGAFEIADHHFVEQELKALRQKGAGSIACWRDTTMDDNKRVPKPGDP